MIFWTCFLLLVFMATTSVASIDKQVYIIHMDKSRVAANLAPAGNYREVYQAVIASVNNFSSQEADQDQDQETSPPEVLYAYETAISGFAAKLSTKHLELLKQVDGFLSATPDEMLTLHTTHSPKFLSLKNGEGLWSPTNLATDVIVGVIDSGIWPEHISFQDTGMSPVPSKWKGDCEEGAKFSKSNCNKKLIGARFFCRAYETAYGRVDETVDYRSPRDADGHGTHTASTAAGNLVSNASFLGLAEGSAVGMRYTSRIAAYKVCWPLDCSAADILAAIDTAVSDGVDVLSISLGSGSTPYYEDLIAIASFGATQNGVFVSCSAGNAGPFRSTVHNAAPWLMTVAASYTDRIFPAVVKLGNGCVFEGSSLYFHTDKMIVPLVYGKTAGSKGAEYCIDGSLNQTLVKGKIVICQNGNTSMFEKGEVVKLAKGAAMIIVNTDSEGEEHIARAHVLPAVAIGAAAGNTIKMYVNSFKKANASIVFYGTVYGKTAPVMAAFSSRGPSKFVPNVIKPDVTAPGVNILAAWPSKISPTRLKTDKRRVLFNVVSGTSMACPHVSGLAALLKSVHQDWSPAAIKSALMTTAYTLDNKKAPIAEVNNSLLATPFAFGSGHVDPENAADPGLIYDITTEDYLNFLCSLNYKSSQLSLFSGGNFTCPQKPTFQPGDLNYPSFAVIFEGNVENITVQRRTVTNVGTPICSYAVQVEQPNGVLVSVEPQILNFENLGQQLSYKVTFVRLEAPTTPSSNSAFGSLTWISGNYRVRSPIAVTWQ